MILYAQTVAPAAEPLSAADLRAHARITDTSEDALLTAYLLAARTAIEQRLGTALITQTWTASLRAWPSPSGSRRVVDEDDLSMLFYLSSLSGGEGHYRIPLRPAPVQSVTSVTVDGVALDAALWRRVGDEVHVSTTAARPAETMATAGIVVTFVTGYGNAAAAPAPLVMALRLLAAHLYENREATAPAEMAVAALPLGVDMLLRPYEHMRGLG